MVEFYSGSRNITDPYARFYFEGNQPRPGRSADGNFSSEEVSLFAVDPERGGRPNPNNVSVLTFLQGELAREGADPELAARFDAYRSYIRNGCVGVNEGLPVAQGLYEEVTRYIESPRFEHATPVMQDRLVGLQADLFARLAQRGIHRRGASGTNGGGTAGEDVQFNPTTEAFQPNPRVLANVLPVSRNLSVLQGEEAADLAAAGFEAGVCMYHQEDQTGRGQDVNYNVYPSGTPEERPFTSGRVTSISRTWLLNAMPEVVSQLETFFTVSDNNPDRLLVRPRLETVVAREVSAGRMSQSDGDYLLQLLEQPINMDFRFGSHERPDEDAGPAAQAAPAAPIPQPQEEEPLVSGDSEDPLGGLGDF